MHEAAEARGPQRPSPLDMSIWGCAGSHDYNPLTAKQLYCAICFILSDLVTVSRDVCNVQRICTHTMLALPLLAVAIVLHKLALTRHIASRSALRRPLACASAPPVLPSSSVHILRMSTDGGVGVTPTADDPHKSIGAMANCIARSRLHVGALVLAKKTRSIWNMLLASLCGTRCQSSRLLQ